MKECRYCLEGGGQLMSPCNCKGHIKWVHVQCWLAWFMKSNNNTCEICKQKYYIPCSNLMELIIRFMLGLGLMVIQLYLLFYGDGVLNAFILHCCIYLHSVLVFPTPPETSEKLAYNLHVISIFFHIYQDRICIPIDIICIYLAYQRQKIEL